MKTRLRLVGLAIASAVVLVGMVPASASTVVPAPSPTAKKPPPIHYCHQNISLVNPQTRNTDNKLGLSLSWEETNTASGRAEARIRKGNALFIINNHTDKWAVEVTQIDWFDFGPDVNVASAIIAPGYSGLIYAGTSFGMAVNVDGTVKSPWTTVNVHRLGAFRSWIEDHYTPNGELHVPVFRIYLVSGSSNAAIMNSIFMSLHQGKQNCGHLQNGT